MTELQYKYMTVGELARSSYADPDATWRERYMAKTLEELEGAESVLEVVAGILDCDPEDVIDEVKELKAKLDNVETLAYRLQGTVTELLDEV